MDYKEKIIFIKVFMGTNLHVVLILLGIIGFTTIEARTTGFCCKREFYGRPAPFEKIYVNQGQIISTYGGTFLKHCDGTLERVRTVLYDHCGMYVLKVKTQCPQCGRCYDSKTPHADFSCPIYEKEILPGYWGPP